MTTLEGVTPYPPEFAARYRALGYWEDRSMADFFDEICTNFADRIALVAGDQRITYHELAERAERLALHLLERGLRPLDRFVLQLPNIPEFVYLYFALQKVGAIPIMALAPHRYTEIEQFVRLSEAVGYAIPERLGDFSFTELAMRVQQEHPCLRSVFVVGQTDQPGWVSLTKLAQTESGLPRGRLDEIEVDPTLPALFQLSGGTTGVPKLIPRTHNDYLYNSKAAAAINDIHADDALLMVLPLSHNFPLASPGLQGFLMHGARTVLSTSTRPADLFNCIAQERITHLELVPTLLIRMLSDPTFNDFDLSSLRVINTGGQKLQAEVKRRAEGIIPACKVQEVFGMAEGLLCYVRLGDPDELRYETAGRPVSPGDELRLVDEQGNEVPDGEIGELLVRGPYTLRGYYRMPEYNARVFTADGFYKTGDLMRRHPSGNYIVEGRKKDLINRGGEKISAEEVENLILAHPAVLNVACVPMPDPQLGERMCAFVVLRPGMTLTLQDLNRFLLEKDIAKFKLPERLELLDELPLSRIGKVLKLVLIERAKAFTTTVVEQRAELGRSNGRTVGQSRLGERGRHMSRTTTVGRFLLRRLSEAGITHLFGVPGDYNLELLDELERCARLKWVGTCNELNAAYAADGFGRIQGIAAVLVTYGVGTLSALNGIAGAYAEQVPVVAITGAPPLAEIEHRALLHHTLATGDFENVMRAMREFTVAQTFLEPSNAVAEIDRVLRECLVKKRPIHIELPSDVASICVEEPEEAFQPPRPTSDERSLHAFIQDALTALRRAKSPALLVDACVNRFRLREQLHRLLRTSGLPVVSMVSAKGTVDEQHAQYLGLYTGQTSDPYVRETIEGSDCLLTFGVQLTDAATAGFSHTIDPTRTITVDPYSARINRTYYAAVTMRDIMERLTAELTVPLPSVGPVHSLSERKNQRPATARFQDGTITHDWLWPRIQRFLRPDDILVADNGTSLSGVSGLMLPSGVSVVSQPLWASIGYTLPAVLGTLLAAPDRRQLLFIGDGSFQMTAQELSTILRHDLKAIIFLINNDGYTIERLILGESSSYNDIQPWRYTELCRVFDPLERAQSFCVTTRQQLEDVLTLAETPDRLTFVEVVMDRMDAPQSLKALGSVYAERAYGPLFE